MIFDESEDTRPDAVDQEALLITILRLYDTLMAMYHADHPEEAERLYKLHQNGGFGSPLPHFDPRNIVSE